MREYIMGEEILPDGVRGGQRGGKHDPQLPAAPALDESQPASPWG